MKRNPFHVKFFLSVGDWCGKMWMEELKGLPGFLLRNLFLIRKPYHLLYIPIMVTEIQFLNKNPVALMVLVIGLLKVPRSSARLPWALI